MEIIEIVSYYLTPNTKTIDVSFRTNIDNEDEVRTDSINLNEAEKFGFEIIQKDELFEIDEDEDDFGDEFEIIDEDILLEYLNEYYVVYPHKLPIVDLY